MPQTMRMTHTKTIWLAIMLPLFGAGCGGDSDSSSATVAASDAPATDLVLVVNDLCIDGQPVTGGSDLTLTNLLPGGNGATVSSGLPGGIQVNGRSALGRVDIGAIEINPVEINPVTPCGDGGDDSAPPSQSPGWVPGVISWTGELTLMEGGQQFTFPEIDPTPAPDGTVTPLSANRIDGILMLDGPGVDGLILMRVPDCADNRDCTAWQLNPRHEPSWYGLDEFFSHTNAHLETHYHGLPDALFDAHSGELRQVGMAADGHPIASGWFDDNGLMRRATSSYHLKTGVRTPQWPFVEPYGPYNGEYVQDYEYVADSGDLDECNGMVVNGVYTYFMTDDFPYLMNCFRGTPHASFLISPP